jgi:hypothetical protein
MTHYESLLNSIVALYSSATSSNTMGQLSQTWVYHVSGVKCRLVPTAAEQLIELPGEFEDVKYTAYFMPSTTLSNDYRVKISGNSNYYRIRNLYTDSESITQKSFLSEVDQ